MEQHVMKKKTGTAWNYWTQKAFGTNLGNWLVLEWWMGHDVFDQVDTEWAKKKWPQDEWTLTAKAPNPAELLKKHWDSWVTEADFQKMAAVNVNHIRIPVGYWAFIPTDQGEPYVTHGQKAQIERILGYCATYQMYAIIDLHGLPGSQNGEMHSGQIGGKNFYTDANVARGLKTVQAVVDWMNGLEGRLKNQISGIEAANEPQPPGDAQRALLRDYYQRAYNIIDASPFKVAFIFHDAFLGPSYWNDFLPAPANAVLDLHPYWAFGAQAKMNSIDILEDIGDKLSGDNNFHLPVLYGEWSLASGPGVVKSEEWLRQFMDTQISVYQQGNAAGAISWALKNKWDFLEWSFEKLIAKGIINKDTFSLHTNAKH